MRGVEGCAIVGNADTGTDMDHLAIYVYGLGQVHQYTLGQLNDLAPPIVAGHQQAELISNQPGNGCLRANKIRQTPGDGYEYLVADEVSQFIINGFESIQIQIKGSQESTFIIYTQFAADRPMKRGFVR